MQETTLALAILLASGFAMAKLGQLLHLPSVTGYICAGILLGPSGIGLLTHELLDEKLRHFTQIAIMLIALGIGEHMEIRRLRKTIRTQTVISGAEILCTILTVGCGVYFLSGLSFFGLPLETRIDFLIIALLLGTVAAATAPDTTLHVMREAKAVGPLTTTLLQSVAINNGMAIMLFGFALATARHLAGGGAGSFSWVAMRSVGIILSSLALGVSTGYTIDKIFKRLKSRGEMLTIGLALLLLAGELARYFAISPLLVGMSVGFTIVNRERRDVRLFRVVNSFEPPIYVLFFILAGAHLEFASLKVAGWLGLLYFVLRAVGKIVGARLGSHLVQAPPAVQTYLGLALIPQAGVAIGLVFLLASFPHLEPYAAILLPAVLTGALLAEIIGPACAKLALERAGEAMLGTSAEENGSSAGEDDLYGIDLVPWTWQKLEPAPHPERTVLFGVSQLDTVAGLSRMATLLAHHLRATPLVVRISQLGKCDDPEAVLADGNDLFRAAAREAETMGYTMQAAHVEAGTVAAGIVDSAETYRAQLVLLGYPLQHTEQQFKKVVEEVVNRAPCRVVLVRFAGILHTERILVPVIDSAKLEVIRDVLCAMVAVGKHRVTLLRLLPSDASAAREEEERKKLRSWASVNQLPFVRARAVASETRLETILQEAEQHDLLVMAGSGDFSLPRKLFGSLADDVANRCRRPMLLVYGSSDMITGSANENAKEEEGKT